MKETTQTHLIWSLAFVLAFHANPLIADEQDEDSAELETIVVTAPLGPKTIGEDLSSVTTIEQEEIRRQQPKQFSDVIRAEPGVSVQNSGGIGQQTSVYLRGHESDGTVLLVNGIRIRSATTGIPAWDAVPQSLVNRVEIIRGGRSSLYGSDAMGGVIQIFTTPQDEGSTGWVEAGAGNLDTQQYSVGAASVDSNSSINAGVTRFVTDGSPVVEQGDSKRYRNEAGTFNASQTFDNGVKVNVTALGSEGDVEYEGGSKDFVFQTAGAAVELPINDYWRSSIELSDARDEQTFFSSFGATDLDSKTRTSRLENWFVADVHEFVVGAETMTDQVLGSTTYVEDTRRNDAYFAQALLNFGPTSLNLSARTDDNEAYGTNETWGAAFGYRFGAGYRFRVNAGTSFKAPTFNDLYSPFGGANPDLEPEEATSYEVGLEKTTANWFWGMTVYQSDVENLIVSFFPQPSENVDQADLRGVEAVAGWADHGWSIELTLSAGDFKNTETGKDLVNRSEQSASLDVDKDFGRYYVGSTVRAENERLDRDGVSRIPGYGAWDLRGGAMLTKGLELRLSVENVLDKERKLGTYIAPINYVNAGRTYMASLRYDFQL
ncbi:TonB-dependent receptor [Marinobacter sp. CHS3-4]|uniref:TonB-dependent receptor domain-containing protein n=1 Tax=Marinobacter sp. CHS3-4 TaxID=3045174 RepID=UPI0024B52388|nr:TonB-dependent receptor [Marinobacter sp. CHS3-4]MDI9243611.1 TonB-dependent receptor [Marinobacter sp. CHS3-4]